jgi:exopolysaccharide biosynthesis polyprenyl glycosylphosphotransferase
MGISHRTEAIFLFVGDVLLLYVSLFFSLFLRYGSTLETQTVLEHLLPFSILIALWLVAFFIAGLYERHTLLFQKRLPQLLLSTLFANSLIAVLFFYFIPVFGIAPKANLFIYLFVSFGLLFLWRWYGYAAQGLWEKQKSIIIGCGEEFRELEREVNGNKRYNLTFISSIDVERISGVDVEEEVVRRVYSEEISLIVIDLCHENTAPMLPHLYNLLFSNVRFVDLYKLYEEFFGRIPLSLVGYSWFLENISASLRTGYTFIKRGMDILITVPLLVIPLVLYPFVALAVKLEDGGPVCIRQTRVGKNNQPITIFKFRTMLFNDEGKWKERGSENQVTRVGAFLRTTRLDEFPALLNVLWGELSLIGPRPEFPDAVKHYAEELPYYNIRHLILPGLSGWAQLYGEHPHHGTDVSKTKNKLSYDLYYLKNRSFFLDLKIAIKTIKVLLSRSGV